MVACPARTKTIVDLHTPEAPHTSMQSGLHVPVLILSAL